MTAGLLAAHGPRCARADLELKGTGICPGGTHDRGAERAHFAQAPHSQLHGTGDRNGYLKKGQSSLGRAVRFLKILDWGSVVKWQ